MQAGAGLVADSDPDFEHRECQSKARALVQATTTSRVGVIGTVGTMASGAYPQAIAATGATFS